jgi:alpha-1,6-mannosyltransferase
MYSWMHVLLATTCAVVAWYSLAKVREAPERPAEQQAVSQ